MFWLWITIFAFFCLAIASLFDRYFLVGPVASPKTYTFYLGVLTFLISFLLIPVLLYLNINIFNYGILILGISAGIARILAIYFMNKGISKSEIARVMPTIGGLMPIFSFFLFYIYFPELHFEGAIAIIALLILASGSFLISAKKINGLFTFKNLKYSFFSAIFFSITFLLIKILFLKINFVGGLYLISVGSGIAVSFFLLSKNFRKEIFAKKIDLKVSNFFVLGQVVGGVGALAQYYAIFLANPAQVPLINAMEGLKYLFLFLLVFILSIWRPNILKESFSGESAVVKIIASILICIGLGMLYLS